MVQNVFVLGLPGSGKSTAARYIEMLARDNHWSPNLLQDYCILYKMFRADRRGIRFSRTLHNGFDVHDFGAFDDALKELMHRLQKKGAYSSILSTVYEYALKELVHRLLKKESISKRNVVNIIEFARDDYCKALELFTSIPLAEAFFLFVNAEIETCKQRIKARAENPQTPDDHYVSPYIFEAYYNRDHRQYLTSTATCLTERFHIATERIAVIDNTNGVSMEAFLSQVEKFVTPILQGKIPFSSEHEADPVR